MPENLKSLASAVFSNNRRVPVVLITKMAPVEASFFEIRTLLTNYDVLRKIIIHKLVVHEIF